MEDGERHEELLLALLNSTPVVEGVATDVLADLTSARAWLIDAGGLGTDVELRHVLRARRALQGIVRGEVPTAALDPLLRGVACIPAVHTGITWSLKVPPERKLAVLAVLAWNRLVTRGPGRLRPCANDECRLFLIDRSAANGARWCSMAVCGNRMKARRHYRRQRDATGTNP